MTTMGEQPGGRLVPIGDTRPYVVGAPRAELAVFGQSGHMTYEEENQRYLAAECDFLERYTT